MKDFSFLFVCPPVQDQGLSQILCGLGGMLRGGGGADAPSSESCWGALSSGSSYPDSAGSNSSGERGWPPGCRKAGTLLRWVQASHGQAEWGYPTLSAILTDFLGNRTARQHACCLYNWMVLPLLSVPLCLILKGSGLGWIDGFCQHEKNAFWFSFQWEKYCFHPNSFSSSGLATNPKPQVFSQTPNYKVSCWGTSKCRK